MAVTQNTYTGNGSTVLYSFTFPYLETTDIKVSVNGTVVTTYTFANATTIQFNTAPANGAAIRIYRQTDDSALPATFYSGSAIRSADLNDNFTQNLYVTQESTNNAATATTTANTALSNSSTALSQSNTAIADSATALSQSNTAISDSATALSQSNTAISDSASAVSTANSAASDASTALSQSNTAISDSATALSQSNTAIADSATAISDSATALSTANTALSTANTALSTANTADANANAALNAIAGTVQYALVANVAAIPGTPANGDAIEIADSTGIENFTPLTNIPAGYVGDTGLSVRLQYLSSGSTWNWLNYFPNNSETRYLKLAGGSVTGNLEIGAAGSLTFEGSTANTFETTLAVVDPTADRTITLPNVTGTVVTTGDTGTVTSTMITDGTIVDGDINASAAIAGTKISPDFGSQNVTTTGTATAAALIPSGSSVPTNGVYLPSANNVAISTNGTQRLLIDSSGNVNIDSNTLYVDATNNRVGLGTSSPSVRLEAVSADTTVCRLATSDAGQSNILAINNNDNANYGTVGVASGNGTSTGDVYSLGYTSSLSAAATSVLSWTSQGRVGIGTAIPGSPINTGRLMVQGGDIVVRDDNVGNGWNRGTLVFDIRNSNGDSKSAYIQSNKVGDVSSTLQFFTTATHALSERMRIDDAGRLLVGTSSGGGVAKLQVQGSTIFNDAFLDLCYNGSGSIAANTNLGVLRFTDQASNANIFAQIACATDAAAGTNDYPGRLVFSTTADGASSPTERMRISSTGTTSVLNGDAGIRSISTASAGTSVTLFRGSHSGYDFVAPGLGTECIYIWSNGNVVNTNNSYGAISDIKLKENIVDANSQWDDLKALQVRNYNFKEGQAHTQIGLVAQEVELVSPGLVTESPDRDAEGNDLGTVTKSVNYSVLYMKAVKALQEAMERIEVLETSNADLVARVTALEGV